ncbi:hypothetical protein Droror1_Dr00013670 [Drosera rotundifolia]
MAITHQPKQLSMAPLFILLLFILVPSISSSSSPSDMSILSQNHKVNLRTDDEVMTLFESWLVKYKKNYNAIGEKEKRFEIFKDSLRFIDEENSQGDHTYKLGLNKFADLTNEEFRSKYLGVKPGVKRPEKRADEKRISGRYASREDDSLPESVDWREKGAVAPIKDQGGCGECRLISTSICLLTDPLISFLHPSS